VTRHYYYAGGRRIELEAADEFVALDEKSADAAGLAVDVGDAPVRRLPGGVVIAQRSQIDDARLASLSKSGALRPVFKRDRALIVALPEIRVEFDNAEQRQAVKAAIAEAPVEVTVSNESASGLVLRPTSGLSDDTLAVANYVYERAHPAAASVRFVQFVPKPGVRP
jgi:hypothetical protein